MGLFTRIEGDAAVIVSKGVYKQVDLYSRDGALYAKAAGGFIKLNLDGSTSKAELRLETLSTDALLFKGRYGWLSVKEGQALGFDDAQRLLGPAS